MNETFREDWKREDRKQDRQEACHENILEETLDKGVLNLAVNKSSCRHIIQQYKVELWTQERKWPQLYLYCSAGVH